MRTEKYKRRKAFNNSKNYLKHFRVLSSFIFFLHISVIVLMLQNKKQRWRLVNNFLLNRVISDGTVCISFILFAGKVLLETHHGIMKSHFSKITLQYILSMIFVCCGGFVDAQFYFNNCRSINCSKTPSKHFNVGSTLLLGWYDITTLHNVKSTLKQRCIRQR